MSDDMKRLTDRYDAAMHAVQSGIKMELELDDPTAGPEKLLNRLKHHRVGIDSAHVSDLGLAELLMRKGVFTELEYVEAIAVAAEKEQLQYEARLSERMNTRVALA